MDPEKTEVSQLGQRILHVKASHVIWGQVARERQIEAKVQCCLQHII